MALVAIVLPVAKASTGPGVQRDEISGIKRFMGEALLWLRCLGRDRYGLETRDEK